MRLSSASVGWACSEGLVPYRSAVAAMEVRAAGIAQGSDGELIWCLEHDALYTSGRSARVEDLLDRHGLPVWESGRGGRYTYHGPGQRVVYIMLDLDKRGRDVRGFVTALEDWIIAVLAELGVVAYADRDRVGLWVARPQEGRCDKIAAVGLRIRKWVSSHGVSINLAPDLSHYSGIVPCGIDPEEAGVTSLSALGVRVDMVGLDKVLKSHFEERFGSVHTEVPLWP